MLIFAAFNVLWTSLLLPLREPPHSMSHGAIGLLGLVGAAGALGAARAGRLADRGLGRGTTGVALALLLVSWLPIALVRQSLLALVVGLVLLDLAVQAVHVTSQSMIYEIEPAARSRLVGAYMVFYSIGSAGGAIASTTVYARAGWAGVCLLGAAISATALAVWAIAERRRRSWRRSPRRGLIRPRRRLRTWARCRAGGPGPIGPGDGRESCMRWMSATDAVGEERAGGRSWWRVAPDVSRGTTGRRHPRWPARGRRRLPPLRDAGRVEGRVRATRRRRSGHHQAGHDRRDGARRGHRRPQGVQGRPPPP